MVFDLWPEIANKQIRCTGKKKAMLPKSNQVAVTVATIAPQQHVARRQNT